MKNYHRIGEPYEGIAIEDSSGECTFPCPACGEESYVDDFDKAYYCINCGEPVIFRIESINKKG